jgi:hypothetical protein
VTGYSRTTPSIATDTVHTLVHVNTSVAFVALVDFLALVAFMAFLAFLALTDMAFLWLYDMR